MLEGAVALVKRERLEERSWEIEENADTFRLYYSFVSYMFDELIKWKRSSLLVFTSRIHCNGRGEVR